MLGVQWPGPLGTALLHSATPVQQGFRTRGQGQKVFVEVSNEDGRCTWPQAWVQMLADMSPHSCGRRGFEPESLICGCLILTFRFLFFTSSVCHSGSFLAATAASILKNISDTASLKPYVQFAVPRLVWLKTWRMLENSETLWGSMDPWHLFFMRPASGLKPHPSLRRQVLLSPPPQLLLQAAKHLDCSWELPSAIRRIASSALWWTDLMGPGHKIIVLTWKIQRLAWWQSTTFSTVD